MNFKKLFFMLTFVVLFATTAFAQNTIYLDVTNGSNTYTGVNPTNNPAGTGPKATLGGATGALAALANVANGGTIIIKAGTYAEALDFTTTLPANVTSYTVKLEQLNANNDIAFTGGASVINKTGLTVTIETTVGTEKITQTSTTLNMTLGSINLGSSAAWVLPTGTTINLAGTSGFTNAAPAKTTNISLNYTGGSSFTAGAESNYGSYGTGTIVVNKTAGTTLTLPNAVTAVAGITLTSGNATFSGAVTVAAGATDVTNGGTGTLTFDGALALGIVTGAVLDANLASIENTAGGSIVANSTVAWNPPTTLAAAAFANALGTDAIHNAGAGSILLNGTVTLAAPNNTTGADYSFFANNAATGTLTIGSVSTPSSGAANFEGTLNLVGAAAAGIINIYGGTYANTVTIGAGHTLNVNGATTVGGVFTNAGTTALGANALTLSGNSAHVTVGGTVTATAPGGIFVTSTGAAISFNGGTLGNVTNNGAGNTVNLSAVTTFTNLTAAAGTITVGANATVNGTLTVSGGTVTDGNFTITVTNYEQSAGTFTLPNNALAILDVNGNFNRTGGTFTAGAASFVTFTGSGAQTVNGGPLFQVGNLTFNNAGGTITVGNSIRASGTITIATATNVDFSTLNLIMNGGAATSKIINNGSYTATGGGGVVVGGINTVTGGLAGGALTATYTLEGTGTYSYITIDVGAGNFAEVINTVTGVKWNGVLTLRSGTLNVTTAGVDFGPTGTTASIVRYPEDSPGIAVTGGTFNAANVTYDLTYTGAITGNKAVGTEITATPGNVRTWTIQTTGAFLNTLPAAAGVNFGGTLIIENGATLDIPTNAAAVSLTLSGVGKAHIIRGTFNVTDATDNLTITGANSTITGSTTTTHAASIDNVIFNSTGLVVTNIFAFTGTVTMNAASTVTLGMGSAAARQQVTGLFTAGGTTLTLTTPIVLNAGAAHTAGTFDMGANDVTLLTGGNWLQTGGSYASTGGYLIFSVAGNLTLTSTIPYLRANNVAITLGSNITVSQNLDIAGALPGTITNAGFNTTIQNNMTTVGGNVFTGAGALILAGTTVTASGNPNISNLTVNSTGIATLASSVAATARTFTVTTLLTLTAGELAIGINHVAMSGAGAAFARTLGTITASTGELRFTGGVAQTANQGTGFTVPNLTINNTTAGAADVTFLGGATNDFTVTGNLRLTAGSFSSTVAGKLHLGNLATITRVTDASTLVQVPTFDGDINLVYSPFVGAGPGVMANEAPTAASGKLNNITINVGAGVTLNTAAAATFKGTATLTSGTWGNAGGTITVASGATVVKNAGAFGAAPTVTNYNLTYTSNQVTTANEFINGAGISVDLLTINPGAGNTVTLHAARSVKDLTITSGTLNNGGFNLTVLGNFNGTGGAYAGAGALIFNGAVAQTMTLPAAGYALGGNLTINNAAGVTLSGGNLTMNAGTTVTFTSGTLNTGANWIQFAHNAAGQGFTRTNGWVNGNVRHFITAGAGTPAVYANGRYEFPVGTATMYRPYAITFTSTYPAISPTNIIVGMVDTSPGGSLNLDAGNGLKIAGYPNYYWLVTATPSSFTSTQLFDVELTGTNIGIPYTSDQNLRIVRRQDGDAVYNPWSLQNGSTYANYSVITGTDTTAVVRTTASIGGIVTQGTRFSIGVPARVPTFGASLAAFTVAEGAETANTVQLTATPSNSGETITGYTKVSGPAWAAVSATGLVTLTPGFTDFAVAPYPVVVRATTSLGMTADHTLNVTVTNTNRAPSFTATGAAVQATASVNSGATHTFTYLAVDADTEALTYTVAVDVAPTGTYSIAAALGTFTFAPVFADAGKVFTFTITATDAGTLTATTTTAITVGYPVAVGDVTGNGTIAADDASEILKYVVGLVTFTPQQMYAADVNNDTMVGALDAAWILYYVVNGTWPTAKMSAAMGAVEIGQLQKEAEGYLLPINLGQTTGVLSVYAELDVDANVEVLGITARAPQGWISASKIENGKVTIAMAGLEPLKDGSIAYLSLRIINKEANATIFGNANLNDGYSAALNSVTVREIPTEFALSQNYPNPFNPTTSIKFAIPENANVQLNVYNMLGQKVRTIMDGMQDAGYYTVNWDGTNDLGSKVSSGIYIYRISAGKYNATMKMNLLK
jgi:hypothetical protein